MKSELIPENGDPPIPILREVTVVGRKEYCDVQINDASLSKRHCVLVRTAGLLLLRDLISTNGTRVKGQKVRWAALLPGDRVTLGKYKVRVYLGSDDVPSPSERYKAQEDAVGFPTPTPSRKELNEHRAPAPILLGEDDLVVDESVAGPDLNQGEVIELGSNDLIELDDDDDPPPLGNLKFD
jgi:pSer/pThr/pTyr-binding forkhead associated (FHA) protein